MTWNIAIYDLDFIDRKLKKILLDFENRFGAGTVTSLYRIGDTGVHGTLPLRAIDLRCKVDEWGKAVENYLNPRWIYDHEQPTKGVCLFHDTGKGWHLHLQAHPNTGFIGG